jgi:TfoX/Sxy family transcriptional regulator of competence genes
MAYDRELVERLHALLASETTLEQKKMFGGIGFMVDGSLVVAATSNGGLLARVGPEAGPGLIGPGVEPMEMNGRLMTGWLRVSPERCDEDEDLAEWVSRSVTFVRQKAEASP